MLAIPVSEARAHDDNSATLHAETYPLHKAAEAGDLDAANHFITIHGVAVNSKNDFDRTPLHQAADRASHDGHVSVVSLLIAAGAEVNAKSGINSTPLHYAAESGYASIASLLIAAEAEVNAKNDIDETPLHEAAVRGYISVVSLLITAGANVNVKDSYQGNTPLLDALGGGFVSIAFILIAAGAEANTKNNSGETPLHHAASSDYFSIVPTLIATGADVNAKKNNGKTPLHIAVSNSNSTVALVILAFGADVHIKDDEGYPALIDAAYYGLLDVVNRLLELGADVNAKGDDGWTALHEAAFNAHLDVVNLLLESGGDVNAEISSGEFSGATPLEVAFRRKHDNVRDRLIEYGGHWGEACANGHVVNPAGPSPPCVCEPPNVGTPGECVAPSVESCRELTSAKFYSATLSACVPLTNCQAGVTLNAETNRCDCPAGLVNRGKLCAPESDDFGELSDALLCGAFGGTVRMATGGREVCSGMDANDTFCIMDSAVGFSMSGIV